MKFKEQTIYGLATMQDEIFYVGRTKDVGLRFCTHMAMAKKKRTKTQKKICKLKRKVKLVIIEIVKYKDHWKNKYEPNSRERYWIDYYSKIFPLTNHAAILYKDRLLNASTSVDSTTHENVICYCLKNNISVLRFYEDAANEKLRLEKLVNQIIQ